LIQDEHGRERERYKVPYGASLSVNDADAVEPGQIVASWDPHTLPIITDMAGTLKFHDFVEGVSVDRQVDEVTGLSSLLAAAPKQGGGTGKDVRPMVRRVGGSGAEVKTAGTGLPAMYYRPPGAIVGVEDGARVEAGDIIARLPQESSKTRDITGGVPRV